MARTTLEARFWENVAVCAHGWDCLDCCWPWQGRRDHKGYGHYQIPGQRRPHKAHRLALEWHNNAMLFSCFVFVCHRCDNPSCCNYAHLYPGTAKDNAQDAVLRQRGLGKSEGMVGPKWHLALDAVCAPLKRYTALGVFLRMQRTRRQCSLFALARGLQVSRPWLRGLEEGTYMYWSAWRYKDFHQNLAAYWDIPIADIPPFDGRSDWRVPMEARFDVTPFVLPILLGGELSLLPTQGDVP